MAWVVIFHEAFVAEFLELPRAVQTALAAKARLLESMGPLFGRPHVDTLKNSKHANMKELRFDAADGVWRRSLRFRRGAASRDPGRQVTNRAKAKRGFTAL
jgi:hypothetical protein